MYFEGVYIIPVKKWQCCGHKYSNWAFSPLGSNIPSVIHSRLFIPSSLLFPLFCLFSTLGIRHFAPSTMSLERKLGTVRSCGEWCRPLGGGSNWCPCWPTYTRTTDLPCLVFCSCGWLLRGKVGAKAPPQKAMPKKKPSTHYINKHSGSECASCRVVGCLCFLSWRCRGVSLSWSLSLTLFLTLTHPGCTFPTLSMQLWNQTGICVCLCIWLCLSICLCLCLCVVSSLTLTLTLTHILSLSLSLTLWSGVCLP